VEVVASLSQGRTAAAQCGLFTHKSVPVIFEPPCIYGVISTLTDWQRHRWKILQLSFSMTSFTHQERYSLSYWKTIQLSQYRCCCCIPLHSSLYTHSI